MNDSLFPQRDMVHALVLSEGVYRGVEHGEAAALDIMDSLQSELRSELQAVQWSQPHGPQR